MMSDEIVTGVCNLYFDSLNANDLKGVTKALHFPHFRIMASGMVHTWNSAEDLWTWFTNRTSDDGWHHSTFDSIQPEKLTETKFHVNVTFGRYKEDNSLIGKYYSLYVMTYDEEKWAMRAASVTG